MAAVLSFIVGILGNIISILVFASPIMTFVRVVKNKSTEGFKGIPYVTTLLSTSLWTYYGLLKPDGLLIVTVNGAGSIMQATYVVLFLIYAPKDTKANEDCNVRSGLESRILRYCVDCATLFAFHGSMRLFVVGVMCAGFTVGMYAAPMVVMRTVVRTKSVEYMPFFLSFFLFINAGVWSVYALLVRDYFVGIPNAIGLILGSAQLLLYVVYKSKTPVSLKEDLDVEKGVPYLARRVQLEGSNEKKVGEGATFQKDTGASVLLLLNKGVVIGKSIN